mmetsp:Transcript_2765/g.5474  ORF Transcript_2765/g.5474 Transcript_2765/m.5474 type:complete len:230 (+) Transcript_2765:221-910(+)
MVGSGGRALLPSPVPGRCRPHLPPGAAQLCADPGPGGQPHDREQLLPAGVCPRAGEAEVLVGPQAQTRGRVRDASASAVRAHLARRDARDGAQGGSWPALCTCIRLPARVRLHDPGLGSPGAGAVSAALDSGVHDEDGGPARPTPPDPVELGTVGELPWGPEPGVQVVGPHVHREAFGAESPVADVLGGPDGADRLAPGSECGDPPCSTSRARPLPGVPLHERPWHRQY